MSLDQCEILKYASFKLKRLVFRQNMWGNSPLIIKYLGASLRELILYEPLKIPIIENISIHCLNIITLEIRIESNVDLLVFSYFKNLKIRNLNIIDINCSDYLGIFKNLANNLPTNVKKVSMYCYHPTRYRYFLQHFKEFLENCHNHLETINLLNNPIKSEFLRVVLNYIERSNNNSLKFLGVEGLEKVLDDEESKLLLDQIRAKGVKIIVKLL
jgi:hypothetical protein